MFYGRNTAREDVKDPSTSNLFRYRCSEQTQQTVVALKKSVGTMTQAMKAVTTAQY